MPNAITPAVEEYLEAIYKMSLEGQVIAARLAERMNVSPPTVADMLRRLTENGFVKVSRREGVQLTRKGNETAESLVRRHRLWERFLTDVLGLDWGEVHEEACRLEHAMSPQVEEKLAQILGNPETCPHGFPIPGTKKARQRDRDAVPLSQLCVGDEGVIERVTEEEPKLLQYLATLGLFPDARVKVKEIAPFKGPMLVRVAGSQYALGQEVASKIMVKGSK
ncbi:MAG: metal-dependent transcriptional regulator [Actinomycetota bacterium]|jgi:DtxR family Mn-dependent transcriptional regulator|nr:metal-dependent transcriptional regulator [Actinomycetota bacterium]MCL6092593.1 metal-dependent transcriptional regulator [Actinomycetota bacterium]MDA8166885.1 metal-dependent transcriptional regulator [Actinomycetota bacterium]